ncbi:MAG: hypothetical protein IAI49_14785 [Candidatus Eremiobacteraeota bacterium]|nr:hypothetical protein [Candidatus Eremiobacteraeota bacterium]
MSRVETQTEAQSAQAAANASLVQTPTLSLPPIEAVDPEERYGNGPSLPSDHPAWMRDSLSISQRARALLASIKPVVVRVIAFWEHRARTIAIGGRTLCVDASGSYRFE